MPYISRDRRAQLDPHIGALRDALTELGCTPGDVNYCVTSIVATGIPADASYADYNEAIGILECAKLELYRVQVAPYESLKRFLNSPVGWIRRRPRATS